MYGSAAAPAVAAVGVWDPLLTAHRDLFHNLGNYAGEHALSALVVVIDPDPGLLLWGKAARPIYTDVHTRMRAIRSCGIEAIIYLRFTKTALRATASDFFDVLDAYVRLREVWLGMNQMLGNGEQGTIEGIIAQARPRNIRITVLPELGVKAMGYQALGLLKAGEVEQATLLAGNLPMRSRPRSYRTRYIEVAWTPGIYHATPVADPATTLPDAAALTGRQARPIELIAGDGGMARFRWPDPTARYVAFTAGPRDRPKAPGQALRSNPQLVRIVNQSATLYDRFSGRFQPDTESSGPEQAGAVIEQWSKIAADGSLDLLNARLIQEGYDLHRIMPLLGPVEFAEGADAPSWMEILAACLQAYERGEPAAALGPPPYIEQRAHLAFQDLFFPCIDFATQRLREVVGISLRHVSAAGIASMQRNLLQQLSGIAYQTLHLEYSVFRQRRLSPLDRIMSVSDAEASHAIYTRFVAHMFAGGMIALFEEYPVLARLIATALELWIQFMTEFLFRLDRDLRDISAELFQQRDNGPVVHIQGGISDSHNRGRSVLVLTFQSGDRLVYKPKEIQLECEYANLQRWLNAHGATPCFRPLTIIPRYGYGWAEYAPHAACRTVDEVQRFFVRGGMILCLMYVLEGTDFHNENIIASGEHPQIIDLETLLHHHFQAAEDIASPSAKALAEQRIWKSVLRTLLLPNWIVNKDGSSTDIGGLGNEAVDHGSGSDSHAGDGSETGLNAFNSTHSTGSNLVYLGEQHCPAGDYVDYIAQGFESLYQLLMANRNALVADDGPLSHFATQPVRFVLRPTETYSSLARKALRPEYLRDGAIRGIQLDALSTIFIQDEVKSAHWPILRAEHLALEQLDVPYFLARAANETLYFSDGTRLPDFFPAASYPVVMDKIAHLSCEDLEMQKQFIRLSFYAYHVRDISIPTAHTGSAREAREAEDSPPVLGKDDLVEAAVTIAEYLATTAVHAGDQSVTWIGLQYHPQGKRYQLRPIGYDLYGGSAGIGLFLAGIARVTGLARFRELALSTVKTARQVMPSAGPGKRFAELMGLGGFSGMGSVIYCLSAIASLLGNESCYKDACSAAFCISDDRLLHDAKYDILNGSAGLLMALLHLYESDLSGTISDKWRKRMLDMAMCCGDHLVRSRTASQQGFRAWLTLDQEMCTGFSHGAAGIAYALLRLFKVAGIERYRTAAQEAIAYEQSLYSLEKRNWPHSQNDPGRHQFLTQWCHGAPGIGLARIGALDVMRSSSCIADIEIAISSTRRYGYALADYLCCGNLGRASILLQAGQSLERPDLELAAQELTGQSLHLANKQSHDSIFGWRIAQPANNPGFMRGLSGVGYCLLEMATESGVLPMPLRLAGQQRPTRSV